MIEITDEQIASWVTHYMWPLFRILGFFAVVPIFGAQTVPMRVRVLLGFVITVAIVPMLPAMPDVEGISLENFVIIAQQMGIGVALGFMVLVMFQVFVVAGQSIAMQMGLGFASMMDPSNGVSVAILSQWYLTLITLIFVAIDGHLVVFQVLIDSFYTLPIGMTGLSEGSLMMIATMGSWMFASAFVIALPSVTALLIVNLAFGIMTRSAPQLNIFALGFPITMLMGIFIMWASFTGVFPMVTELTLDLVPMMRQLELHNG
ncbi:MAG: flagellar type III secretion system protein FliR [Natronospirillum sp.]|uniref:flagellar biosynthetic protein FliR n=1 Tax=Natronospirillum sp. TaxID=2812955 RepID=UPI0025E2B491|nr:flagellar biosynthetic protein FliR [Natronospirillum sp.]MCH8551286.1 flagellar type III secretion system protein FliR [Natronospirillum sp.]